MNIPATAALLSPSERHWLDAHPDIRLGFHSDMEPMLIVADDGNYSGILIDIVERLERELNISINVEVDSWPTITAMADSGKIDGLLAVTPRRISEQFLLTKPLHKVFNTVFARSDQTGTINKIEDIAGSRISYLNGDLNVADVLKPFANTSDIVTIAINIFIGGKVIEYCNF